METNGRTIDAITNLTNDFRRVIPVRCPLKILENAATPNDKKMSTPVIMNERETVTVPTVTGSPNNRTNDDNERLLLIMRIN